MKYEFLGDSDCPIARIELADGEQVRIERGSMVYTRGAKIKGKMNSEKKGFKGVFASIGRAMTSGESFFVTTVTGTSNDAEVGVAPTVPGKIIELSCHDSQQYYLNTGAFLACDTNMGYKMEAQNVVNAGFGGTGGLFVMRTHGDGTMLANAFGDTHPKRHPDCAPRSVTDVMDVSRTSDRLE